MGPSTRSLLHTVDGMWWLKGWSQLLSYHPSHHFESGWVIWNTSGTRLTRSRHYLPRALRNISAMPSIYCQTRYMRIRKRGSQNQIERPYCLPFTPDIQWNGVNVAIVSPAIMPEECCSQTFNIILGLVSASTSDDRASLAESLTLPNIRLMIQDISAEDNYKLCLSTSESRKKMKMSQELGCPCNLKR